MNNIKSWTLDVKEDSTTGEYYIEFTDEILKESGFKAGDCIHWIDNSDGSWTLVKEELTTFINNGIINNE